MNFDNICRASRMVIRGRKVAIPLLQQADYVAATACDGVVFAVLCRSAGGGGGASSSGRQMQSTILGSYQAELREFRALQQELEPWTTAFKEKHGRKPTLVDVEQTSKTTFTATLCWLASLQNNHHISRHRFGFSLHCCV